MEAGRCYIPGTDGDGAMASWWWLSLAFLLGWIAVSVAAAGIVVLLRRTGRWSGPR